MRPLSCRFLVVGFLSLLSGCGDSGGRPRPGDTVTPQLDKEFQWTAGKPGDLGVRLHAANTDGSAPRRLDFGGFAGTFSPVALIQFYEGEQELESLTVSLSHRC